MRSRIFFSLSLRSLKRFEDIVAPYRLNEEQQDGASESELKTLCPLKISDKEMEALRTKVCVMYIVFACVFVFE